MIEGLAREDGGRLIRGVGCMVALRYISNGVIVSGYNKECGVGCEGGKPRSGREGPKRCVLVLGGGEEHVGAVSACEHIGAD